MPFAAGGTTDLLGRILADRLGQRLGGKFIVENRPGAGGNTGVAAVARAPADGYTLTMADELADAFEATGLTCGHCAHAVSEEIKALDGVLDAASTGTTSA